MSSQKPMTAEVSDHGEPGPVVTWEQACCQHAVERVSGLPAALRSSETAVDRGEPRECRRDNRLTPERRSKTSHRQ